MSFSQRIIGLRDDCFDLPLAVALCWQRRGGLSADEGVDFLIRIRPVLPTIVTSPWSGKQKQGCEWMPRRTIEGGESGPIFSMGYGKEPAYHRHPVSRQRLADARRGWRQSHARAQIRFRPWVKIGAPVPEGRGSAGPVARGFSAARKPVPTPTSTLLAKPKGIPSCQPRSRWMQPAIRRTRRAQSTRYVDRRACHDRAEKMQAFR